MNTLYLFGYVRSRTWWKELLLFIQLVAVVLLVFSILLPLDSFDQHTKRLQTTYTVDLARTLHFNLPAVGMNFGVEDPELNEVVEAFRTSVAQEPGVAACLTYKEKLGQIFPVGADVRDKEQQLANNVILLFYSPEFAESFDLRCRSGGWGSGAVVSPWLASQLLEEEFLVRLEDGETFSCTLGGVLEETAVIPRPFWYGSRPSEDVLGVSPAELGDVGFILLPYDASIGQSWAWDETFLAVLEDDADVETVKRTLNEKAGNLGVFETMHRLRQIAQEQLVQKNWREVQQALLLSSIAIFGYGGYLFLMLRQKQREFAVLHILGLSRRRILFLNFLLNALFLALVIAFCYLLAPVYLRSAFGTAHYVPGPLTLGFCAILLALSLTCGMLMGLAQSQKATAISQYQGG